MVCDKGTNFSGRKPGKTTIERYNMDIIETLQTEQTLLRYNDNHDQVLKLYAVQAQDP